MKLFVKLTMLILVAAVAGLFFIKTPDGKPVLSMAEITHTTSRGLESLQRGWRNTTTAIKRNLGNDNAGKVPVYKWQDESGQWHYSDEAPDELPDQAPGQSDDKTNAELIHIDPNINRMDAVSIDSASNRTTKSDTATPSAETSLLQALPTPGRIDKAMQQTRDAKQQLEQRNESMQKRLNDER